MGKQKGILYKKKFKFQSSRLDYQFQLKHRRCWWWLLLLLLPLLLLIRCEREITVTCIDERTKDPVADINVQLEYTAHFLYDKGRLFAKNEHSYEKTTDEDGNAVFGNLECSVFSYIFHPFSKVHVTADDVAHVTKRFHFTKHIIIELENIECDVDIVMCIDNTGSMGNCIGMVQSKALTFCDDLKAYCTAHRRDIIGIRLKVISFGDLRERPIEESPLFTIPDENTEYEAFVKTIVAKEGGDDPENGLEALALAINTPWVDSDRRLRHIIIVYTDAPALDLDDPDTHTRYYPDDMPVDLKALKKRWKAMDDNAKKLVLFAPDDYPWEEMSSWGNVLHKTENLNAVLGGTGYEDVLATICKSL